MKRLKVSVGIPAYNEAANIKNLLKALVEQKQELLKIIEIIVCSDGSTDDIVTYAESLKSNLIKVYHDKKRLGKAIRQNQIMRKSKGEIVVILDADVIPENIQFIDHLIRPIINNKADLVSCDGIPMMPGSFVEKIITESINFKKHIVTKKKGTDSVYLCAGRARAFSRRLCDSLVWPRTIGEDAYSYFYCKFNNYKFFYTPKARVYYRLPASVKDHIKQSARFINSQKKMKEYFDKDKVSEMYRLETFAITKELLKQLFNKPVQTLSYIVLFAVAHFLAGLNLHSQPLWSISETSKRLIKI